MGNSKAVIWVTLLVVAVVLAGCAVALAKGRGQTKALTLFAFNYTDRGILDIRVDGMWMGDASAYVNGGGAMGPRAPRDRTRQHSVEVEWDVSASYYDLSANKYITDAELVSRRATVPLALPYPDDPGMLLLHFYQDGRVEAELIERGSNHFDFRRIPIPEGHKLHGSKEHGSG